MITKITVDRLGHLGDGIAPGPIFVQGALPGEVVSGELIGDRLQQMKIETPSPDRVAPVCAHYKTCGGCSLQHASDEFVGNWKTQIARDALAAHGLDSPVKLLATSPPQSRRRANLAGRRTKKGALVGMHGRRSDTIVAIPGCTLLRSDLIAAIPALEMLTITGGSRKAKLSFAITGSDAGVDIAVTGGKELTGELRVQLSGLANRFHISRLSWDNETVAELAAPTQLFGPAIVSPPPGSFLQATAEGQAALLGVVTCAAGSARDVVDLFAGCGTFSLPLAQNAQICAVENDTEMLAALDAGWRKADGLKMITTQGRDLFRRPLVADELNKFDAVVIDPPRAGAEAQFAEIAKSGVGLIVSVSCNPVTFARDVRMLCDVGYRLENVDVVDQFRWSPHVELVATLSKN